MTDARGRLVLASALAVTCAASAGCTVTVDSGQVVVREEHSFKVKGTPEIELSTFDGSIDIRAWDRPEVLVEVEKRAGTREAAESVVVKAEQAGEKVKVDATGGSGSRWLVNSVGHLSRSARITASVPRSCALTVRSGDGSLTVERVNGTIRLSTDDGFIRGFELSGDVVVDTADGGVKLEQVDGNVKVETGDGPVTLGGRLATVSVHTGDGTVALKVAQGSEMTGDWSVTTGDGGVVVYVPQRFSAEVDAETGDGAVRVDGELWVERPMRSKHQLRGPIGEGGKVLRIRTKDGTISLRKI